MSELITTGTAAGGAAIAIAAIELAKLAVAKIKNGKPAPIWSQEICQFRHGEIDRRLDTANKKMDSDRKHHEKLVNDVASDRLRLTEQITVFAGQIKVFAGEIKSVNEKLEEIKSKLE